MRAAKYDEIFKVVICGDQGVGKKTLLTRFTKENYKLTPASIK
ncbi:unnamed protein product [marine sediment metagenome]|uniref:G domain-containing protein n=1 Tax=marine sediment metagenome TaxID=412755 RepID=X0Z5L7_9ZZZZ